jgi:peroxiredoxin
MVLLHATNISEYQSKKMPHFKLKDVSGSYIDSNQIKCEKGLLVMFICNHCPYVKAIVKDIVDDTAELKSIGIESVAISSNDAEFYPDDSFENMIKFAEANKFTFSYLYDETQQVAKDFGAVCTPDFFLFIKNSDGDLLLKHKGRLNNFIYTKSGPQTSDGIALNRELLTIAEYLVGKTKSSMGCSIKWED